MEESNNIFDYEKKVLKETLIKIEEELEKSKREMDKLLQSNKKVTYDDMKRGEHFNIYSQMNLVENKIDRLERAINTPYFGKMNIILDNSSLKKIYIGRSGIMHDGQILVTDWRAPISSLYYDSEIGRVEYEAPQGKITGNMSLKRQLNIKNGELLDVQDTSLVTNDDLLKPYLSVNADNKMKTIIASIQKEQNDIIRKPSTKNIIVQGVAGSGKTSVALHRIAYLIYQLGDKISSDQFLVLGPNEYFLRYVSSILPELETTPVEEITFINFARMYLEEKINLKNEENITDCSYFEYSKKIHFFKTSIENKELLDNFIDNYIENDIVNDDFIIGNDVIFTKEQIKKFLFSSNEKFPNYKRLEQRMISVLKEEFQNIYDTINKKYRDEYILLPTDNPNRKELIQYSNFLYNSLKNDCSKLVKKYVKSIKKSTFLIYEMYLGYLSSCKLLLSRDELLLLQKETLLDLKKKKVSFSDIPTLMHIMYRLTNKTNNYKYLVIDEAQDYGLFHFAVLKELNPESNFAIYGDLAQAIYSYRSIDTWEKVNSVVFNDKCEIINLNKSYRTTIEITNRANEILDYLNLNLAEPVIRHGVNVNFYNYTKENNNKLKIIDSMINKGYETIAIICKTEKEAVSVNKFLIENGYNSKYLCNNDVEYSGGLFVLTSASSKGLEFDGVIINDASSDVYNVNSNIDMHLLYVASTRPLHELSILYDKELVSVYSDKKEEKAKVKSKIKE